MRGQAQQSATFERTRSRKQQPSTTIKPGRQSAATTTLSPDSAVVKMAEGLFSVQWGRKRSQRLTVLEVINPATPAATSSSPTEPLLPQFRCDHPDCQKFVFLSRLGQDCPHVNTVRNSTNPISPLFQPNHDSLHDMIDVMGLENAMGEAKLTNLHKLINDASTLQHPAVVRVSSFVWSVHHGEDRHYCRNGRLHVRKEKGKLRCRCPQGGFEQHCLHKLLVIATCHLDHNAGGPGESTQKSSP